MLPEGYPGNAPIVFLDEPEVEEIVEMIDYLDSGNRIMFDYLVSWEKEFAGSKDQKKFNLMALLVKVYNLFLQMPPLTMAELFGAESQSQPAVAQKEEDVWENFPDAVEDEPEAKQP